MILADLVYHFLRGVSSMKTHIYELLKEERTITLKEMRTSAGLTQEAVAKKLVLDQASVSYWESGKTKPLRKYSKKLARLYGVTPEEIEEAL